MKLTGIGDEAGNKLAAQIKATLALGWGSIEMRNVEIPGYPVGNIHDIPEEAFDLLCGELSEHGVGVSGFGSTIGNWASQITDPFSLTLERVERAIPRMQRLGTTIIRVMSYAILKDDQGRDAQDQHAEERFRRLRELNQRFSDAGITMVHENCMNYGGMSIAHALETLEKVPGLRWVFDTGNPVFNEDRAHPGHRQNSWDFYQAVKAHISHVHVKDGVWNSQTQDCDYSFPGEGQGCVKEILADLALHGYKGHVSIEPHVAVVFHAVNKQEDMDAAAKEIQQLESYINYGRALANLISLSPHQS